MTMNIRPGYFPGWDDPGGTVILRKLGGRAEVEPEGQTTGDGTGMVNADAIGMMAGAEQAEVEVEQPLRQSKG